MSSSRGKRNKKYTMCGRQDKSAPNFPLDPKDEDSLLKYKKDKPPKPPKKTTEIVIPESGEIVDFSNPKKMTELVKIVKSTLQSLQFSTDEFVKKLEDSG
jgi:hypothetical protein